MQKWVNQTKTERESLFTFKPRRDYIEKKKNEILMKKLISRKKVFRQKNSL